ncbi:MAG: DMT family transporter [Candidatus Diapherotrites archaeon]
MFELSIPAAFGAMLCWGIGDFLIQRTTRAVGDIEALAFIGLFGSIGLLPFVLQDFSLLFSVQNAALLLFLGAVVFVVAVINFEALKKGKLSVVEMVIEVELPLTAVLAFWFFGETLSLIQAVLVFLVFVGILLVSFKGISKGNLLKGLEKGVALAVLTALGSALVNFLTAAGAKQISPLLAVWFPWVIFTVLCFAIIWKREGLSAFFENAKKFKSMIVAMGAMDTFAWVFFATAVVKNELAITTAITESYVAIALVLGVLLNREKIFAHQWAGAAVALGASVMLALMI